MHAVTKFLKFDFEPIELAELLLVVNHCLQIHRVKNWFSQTAGISGSKGAWADICHL